MNTTAIDGLKALSKKYASNALNIRAIDSQVKYSGLKQDSYYTKNSAFMFPVSGSCYIHFDNKIFYARPGKLIHGCPGKHIEFEVTGNEPFHLINIYHDSSESFLFESDLGENTHTLLENLEKIVSLKDNSDLKNDLVKDQLVSMFFELLFSDYMNHNIQNNYELVSQVVAFIHQNYHKQLSLQKISDYAGKRPAQISYLFHNYTGKRPIDYLISYRLSQAIKMLEFNDDLSIQEIAHAVGYTDPLYFSRLFKKHIGCPPSKFTSTYPFADSNLLFNHSSAY
ncbi:MAG: helix-turn-helix domain-containing protein [Lachnospiraceae bacterium]